MQTIKGINKEMEEIKANLPDVITDELINKLAELINKCIQEGSKTKEVYINIYHGRRDSVGGKIRLLKLNTYMPGAFSIFDIQEALSRLQDNYLRNINIDTELYGVTLEFSNHPETAPSDILHFFITTYIR